MKIFLWFKSLSTVHEEEQEREHYEEEKTYPSRNRLICRSSEASSSTISLTVWRKSLLLNCKGFTVIDSNGNLVYRVDNYIGCPNQVILMDASGNSILTLCRRRKFGLLDRWLVYEGEVGNNHHQQQRTRRRSNMSTSSKNSICCVRKCVNILQGKPNVLACVYRTSGSDKRRRVVFTVEGSYTYRTCKVLDECRKVVAEIKRKEANTKNASFGMEIFQLVVYPSFDPAFAMALVLLLDQMF